MTFRGTNLFLGIDGTGVADDAAYAQDFANSHVHRIQREWTHGRSHYWRGPTWHGFEMDRLVDWAVDIIEPLATGLAQGTGRPHDETMRIYLAGYSRGGAAVLSAAQRLQGASHPVHIHCMLLFDAVDRSVLTNAVDEVPANVRNCFHARRSLRAWSRVNFGNCGTSAANSGATRYREREFHGTHGAMGGVPEPMRGNPDAYVSESNTIDPGTNVTHREDHHASTEVWTWMSDKLAWALEQ